jgi:hypothetical protein
LNTTKCASNRKNNVGINALTDRDPAHMRGGSSVDHGGSLAASDAVAQHELGRMRTQVDLSGQLGHVVAPEVVREQRQRTDERHLAGRVRLDERQQLGAIALFECVLVKREFLFSTPLLSHHPLCPS